MPILDCIRDGSLYESARWHNAVFVGRDDKGKAHYAAMRGTIGNFKRDADGSDKRFGFVLPPINKGSDTVAVFESAVDALSHQSLCLDFDGWRLSLGCTALAALTNFLERHGNINSVIACTDNDKAGNIAATKIAELQDKSQGTSKGISQGVSVVRSLPPNGKKDWNDALIAFRSELKPSLISRLESAKEAVNVTAAESSNLAGRERAGASLCL